LNLVEFNKSPIDDIKTFTKQCDIGLLKVDVVTAKTFTYLKEFRKNCKILVSVGECAIMGGLPALRNGLPVEECLHEAYLMAQQYNATQRRFLPNDDELPMILDKVYPCHEIVKIDYFLPGCAPRADLIWNALYALVTGNELLLPYEVVKFD
jgi:NAD-reducing hydrogenase small subunit